MKRIKAEELDDATKREVLVNGFREDHGPVVEVTKEHTVWTQEMVARACLLMREEDCNEADDM